MTGEKNRSTTVEKLWKLDDKELSTPKHDELVLMLLNKEYSLKRIVNETDGYCKINEIRSEIPVQSSNGFIVGFIDVKLSTTKERFGDTFEIQCPACGAFPFNDLKQNIDKAIIEKKVLLCTRYSCNHRFILTEELVRPKVCIDEIDYFIECKPTIRSFGETLRQLNLYKSTLEKAYTRQQLNFKDNTRFILFTPDLQFKDAFESQGILVIPP